MGGLFSRKIDPDKNDEEGMPMLDTGDEEGKEESSSSMSGKSSKGGKKESSPDDDEDSKKGGKGLFSRKEVPYVDPPMPDIGMKVDFDKLLTRKYNVKQAMRTMFETVHNDTKRSISNAQVIPVTDMIERVKVTEPIVDLINTRKTKKEDRQFVKDNLLETQKYISLRKSTLNMMNHNYNDVIVKKLDTVLVAEARTKVIFHEKSHIEQGPEDDDDDDDDDDADNSKRKGSQPAK